MFKPKSIEINLLHLQLATPANASICIIPIRLGTDRNKQNTNRIIVSHSWIPNPKHTQSHNL